MEVTVPSILMQGGFYMKQLLSCLLAALMLFSFAACKNTTVPAAEATAEPTQAPAEPTAEPAPTPLPQGETTSIIAGSLQKDENGVLWTSLAPVEGMEYVYDRLPEDIGHVYSFLIHDGTLYAALKEHAFSMDFIRIAAFDTETGEQTALFTEQAKGNSTFCLLGEETLLYMTEDGLCTLDIPTGHSSEPLAGAMNLLAARNGNFYYDRIDQSGLFRNNSSLSAEETLLENCPSFWLCPGADGFCTLAYNEEGTIAVAEFRAADGTLLSRQPLEEIPTGIATDGSLVYIPQESAGVIRLYDIASGDAAGTLPLPEGAVGCSPLLADSGAVYYQAMTDGAFCLFRSDSENDAPVELARDIDSFR